MSTFFRVITFSFILLGLTTISFAQDKGKKEENFQKIAKLSNSKKPEEKEKAYVMGKDFIAAYGKDTDDKVTKIKDFVAGYELDKLYNLIDAGKTDDAFLLGKDILEKNPENVEVTLSLAYGGYDALNKRKDDSFGGDTIVFAKQTLSFFEKGKLPKSFFPWKNQADATAWMYAILGNFTQEYEPKEAAIHFYNALKNDSELKSQPALYVSIANYYEGVYQQMATAFKAKHSSKVNEDAEMKADNDKIDIVLDRMIDSFARAVKISETAKTTNSESLKTRLTEIYKFRKKTDAGLNELLNNILSTPMPMPN
jgi:hypothetical protein